MCWLLSTQLSPIIHPDCSLKVRNFLFQRSLDPQFPGKCAYNCKLVPLIDNNCTYAPTDRPHDTPIKFIVLQEMAWRDTEREDLSLCE
jgi:hypothetical protein